MVHPRFLNSDLPMRGKSNEVYSPMSTQDVYVNHEPQKIKKDKHMVHMKHKLNFLLFKAKQS